MSERPRAYILVVDDFKEWRKKVRMLLRARPEWEIISEASDGSEAVEKAAHLKPDIILLDVALPMLNGLEAAKIIRQRSPQSRIIFFTQNMDKEIRSAAINIGAAGYVLKTNAAKELLDAIAVALISL